MPGAPERPKPVSGIKTDSTMIKCLIHFQASDKPAFEARIPEAAVKRSPVIREALAMADGLARLVLPFGQDVLAAWATRRARSTPTETLLKGLQAADFFADEVAVKDFTLLLASRMFPAEDSTCTAHTQPFKRQRTSTGKKNISLGYLQQQRLQNEQITQQLSPEVTSAILTATTASLATCISLLPPHIHPLAVSAKCCSGPSYQCLSLPHQLTVTEGSYSNPSTADSSSIQARHARHALRCNVITAAASLTHITSLELSFSFLKGLENSAELRDAFGDCFSSLSSLSELVFQDGITNACVEVLVPALPYMTALQHLGISSPDPSVSSTGQFAGTQLPERVVAQGGWGNQADSAPETSGHTTPCNAAEHEVSRHIVPGADSQAVHTLLSHLPLVPKLRSLALAAVKPDCSDVAEFCAALKQLTGLTNLTLTDCFVSRGCEAVGDGMKVSQRLAGALRKLQCLEAIDLRGSMPGDIIDPLLDSIAGLTQLTQLCLQSVRCMSVVDCPLRHRVTEDNAGFGRRLAPMLSKLKALRFLDLSECYIPTRTMRDVVDAIAGLTCLTGLELQQMSRETCFWDYLVEKVTSLVALEDMIVSMNPCIGDQNIGKLAQSLATLPRLQTFDVHCCRISSAGAATLAEHLTDMTSLKTLHLQLNRIEPEGAKALAECFKTMVQLQQVTLLDTDIGDEGERMVVGALEDSRGPEWQGEVSLSVMEDSKELRHEYFETGIAWFERYWIPPQVQSQHVVFEIEHMPLVPEDDRGDEFVHFLQLMEY